MRKLVFLISAMLMNAGCTARTPVVHDISSGVVKSDRANILKKDGIAYALPRTVISVKFDVVTSQRSKGTLLQEIESAAIDGINNKKGTSTAKSKAIELVNEAAASLGVNELHYGETFKKTDPSMQFYAEQDPAAFYFVELKGRASRENLSLALTPTGLITGGSAEVTNPAYEIGLELANLYSSISRPGLAGGAASYQQKQIASPAKDALENIARGKASDKYDLIIKEVKSRIDLVKKDVDDAEQSKRNFLMNCAVSDSATLKAILAIFDSAREKAAEPICGKVSKRETNYVVELRPGASSDKIVRNLFWFSQKDGLHVEKKPSNRLSIRPEPTIQKISADGKWTSLKIEPSFDDQIAQVLEQSNAKILSANGRRSFRYRIPLQTVCELVEKTTVQSRMNAPIAQMGSLASVPVQKVAKTAKVEFKLDPNTGALISFATTSSSWKSGDIGAIAKTYMENYDEKAKLERRHAMLKMKKEMKEFKEALEK